MQKQSPEAITAVLDQCTGTEGYTRHPFGLKLTDGIVEMAKLCGAFWLVDIVASYQNEVKKKPDLYDFAVWTLTVHANRSATVECRADSDQEPAIRQEIEYTDFPLAEMKMYCEGGVLLLPSEH